MVFSKFKNLSLAQFIVISGLSLRIIQILKETYYLEVFQNSKDLSLFISLKANMDFFLILTTSVFFYETCYKNGRLSIPIFPIIFSILAGIYVLFIKTTSNNDLEILMLVLFGSFAAIFSNIAVVLAKESENLLNNFFANGLENYLLLIVILTFIIFNFPPSFILYTFILIFSQIIITSILLYKFHKTRLIIEISFNIKDSILSLPKIFGSTIILITMILTRTLFEVNTEIIVLNYSLIIATAPLLLIERYFEYSKNMVILKNIKPIHSWIFLVLIHVFVLLLFIPLEAETIQELNFGKIITIALKSFQFFLMLFPLFLYFILFKKAYNFNKNSFITLFISYLICMFFNSGLQSTIFLFTTSFVSSIFLIKSFDFKIIQ